jgi:hypothetical protein
MSTIFEEMDRLAEEKYAKASVATLDVPLHNKRTEESSDAMIDRTNRETFDTGDDWNTLDRRYDLIPTSIILGLLKNHPAAYKFVKGLFCYMDGKPSLVLDDLANLLGVQVHDLAHFYAKVLYKIAGKCAVFERTREVPESILLNYSLYQLFKLIGEESVDDHSALLTWSVLTLIQQRSTKSFNEQQNSIKETTPHDSQS